MKGSTHVLIGLAAASAALPFISSTSGCEKLLPFVFAYTGSLISDMDIGTSTVSNIMSPPIKLKYIKVLIYSIYAAAFIGGTVYFWNSSYILIFTALMTLGGLALNSISSTVFRLIKRVSIILFSIGLIIFGILHEQPPTVLIGIFLSALIFSPHRGYSHSLIAVAVAFFILKYTFSFYNMTDYSLSFSIGMLSHILADMLTSKGVDLLFPLRKRFSFPVTFKTGSLFEVFISSVSLVIVLINLEISNIF